MAPAPVDHNWAKIVPSTTTSLDVPGTLDAATMDTEPGSRAMRKMMSSVTIEGQGVHVPVSKDGLQPARDAPPGHVTAPSNQDSSNHNHLKWTDEDPEIEHNS
jgi:hypothetical protein